MIGERVASREVAVGLARGAMADLALEGEAAQAERVARLAARVPDDTHGAVSARLDTFRVEQDARLAAKGLTTVYTEATEGDEAGRQTFRGEDFSHLPRRERRYLERLARKEGKRARRAA